MGRCKLLTNAGRPCLGTDTGRGLCHLHDPDGKHLRQRPADRQRMLQRRDVLAVLGIQPISANHCMSCQCVASAGTAPAKVALS